MDNRKVEISTLFTYTDQSNDQEGEKSRQRDTKKIRWVNRLEKYEGIKDKNENFTILKIIKKKKI